MYRKQTPKQIFPNNSYQKYLFGICILYSEYIDIYLDVTATLVNLTAYDAKLLGCLGSRRAALEVH